MIPAIDRQHIEAGHATNAGGPSSRAPRTPMSDRPGAFLPDQLASFPVPTRA